MHFKRRSPALRLLASVCLAMCATLFTGALAQSSAPVTLEFWAWVQGSEDAVACWNESHPDVQVNYTRTTGGTEHYNKLKTAVAAGAGGPDVAQVEFQLLTSMAVNGVVQPITQEAASAQDAFIDWTWQQVTLGGEVYAIPQDIGPMAMFYNKELFEAYDIAVPTTWEEFAAAAETLHAADPSKYIAHLPPNNVGQFVGFVWQNNARWFGVEGDAWQVSIGGEESKEVAAFWQDLIARDLVKVESDFNPAWYQDLANGTVATWVSAVWGAGTLATNVPDGAGKWAVAYMPQWEAGAETASNWGGSTTAVIAGSEHVKEAVEFATYLNSDPCPLGAMIRENNIFPATTAGANLPVLNEANPYFGGQVINDVFRQAAQNVDPSWTWGPTMDQVYATLGDQFTAATNGTETLSDALDATQESTVTQMNQMGLTVAP